MRPDGELARWLAKAKPGRCPCGRKRPEGHERLCGRAECREKYQRLYGRDRTLSTLRRVVKRHRVEGRPLFVRLELACGHFQQAPRSKAQRSKKRHCRECPLAQSTAAVQSPAAG